MIRKVVNDTLLLESAEKYLIRKPKKNLMLIADLRPPLLSHSDVFCLTEGNVRVQGVGIIFKAFHFPSVVLAGETKELRQKLLKYVLSRIKGEKFVTIVESWQIEEFKDYATLLESHTELHMVVDSENFQGSFVQPAECNVRRVNSSDPDEVLWLDEFYTQKGTFAWNAVQLQAGPYYVAEKDGEILSVAGIHFVHREIGQLGNVLTIEKYRRRGLGTATTVRVVQELLEKWTKLASLFVTANNHAAIQMYKQLGFSEERKVIFGLFNLRS